jgi:hypothetical protein
LRAPGTLAPEVSTPLGPRPVVWRKHAGLPGVMVWDLSFDRGYTTRGAWTRSRGAWVWPLPVLADALFANGFEDP